MKVKMKISENQLDQFFISYAKEKLRVAEKYPHYYLDGSGRVPFLQKEAMRNALRIVFGIVVDKKKSSEESG